MEQELYDRLVAYILENQNRFYRLAFSYVKNQEDALDIVQNAVCKALSHYEGLKHSDALKAWFYKILLHECFALLSSKKRFIPTEDSGFLEIPYEEKRFEAHDDLYAQLGRMDAETQAIIKLRFFEDMALDEIAKILNKNLNTVKTKLYRGLKALKIAFEKEADE